MGVQSLDENLLERLGRIHTRDQVFRSLEILRGAGFDNVNLDLMFAIPGQSMAAWRATLDETVAMGTEHLSCYEVIYEEDTPLFAQLQAGRIEVDEELAGAMFEELVDRAGNAGFIQYEVANFARNMEKTSPPGDDVPRLPDRACRHNVNYWRGGDYFGLGPSASEYLDGLRSKNRSNTEWYCQELATGRRSKDYSEKLSPLARAGEIAAFGLRMNTGWPFELFRAVTGFDLETDWSADIHACVDRGWGVATPEGFRLTRLGLRFADAVAGEFLRPEANLSHGTRPNAALAAIHEVV
jgi:oxygen-independent coproporphyrinogen-3 oxidase